MLRKALRETGDTLKNSFHPATAPRTDWQRWLWDHYYALDGELQQTLGDLRHFSRHGKERMRLFTGLWEAFHKNALVTEAALTGVLRKMNEAEPFREEDFDFLRPALKSVLLLRVQKGCESENAALLAHGIQGLSALGGFDFDGITREISLTEQILSQDPDGVYQRMEPASRRHYRHAAGRIARRSGVPEGQVAREILECAQKGETSRERHVGFYLLNHDPWELRARRQKVLFLIFSVLLPVLFAVILALFCGRFWVGLAALLPLGELVRAILRPILLHRAAPRHLPRMELPPEEERPVIVAALVTLLPELDELGAVRCRLERLRHANQGQNMLYCLLADYPEARKPWFPQDNARLEAAKRMITALNAQYEDQFMLVVRRRVWCKTRDKYCGWERKRGAVTELIRFARNGDTSVNCFVGDRKRLSAAKYLLVLDADTELGFDGAQRLLSAALHPLNAPEIENERVRRGYAILCPAVETVGGKTLFSILAAGTGGHGAYAKENTSLAWDLFGETHFVGKGLIQMDAFDAVMPRRIPEESILSHDVLEGAYLRSALVYDAIVTENTPANALAWYARLHRWVRGDWQNAPFLGRHVGKRENPIGFCGRLFLLENLRCSLFMPAMLLCLILSAFSTFRTSLTVSILILLTLELPYIAEILRTLRACGIYAFSDTPSAFSLALRRFGWALSALAQQGIVSFDAIIKSLWRLHTKQDLLEWTTAARADEGKVDFGAVLRKSRWSALLGLLLFVFAPFWHVKLFGLAFLIYPAAVVLTARPRKTPKTLPNRSQRERLVDWCAQMLGYYEQYANKKNHWLPPDNVQYSPVEAVARRTSPTNIGMMLLSYLAARDMGLLDSAALSVRLTRTLDTVEKLEQYRGNLYNWYATDDLRILPPGFVSSVDSGNFLCALTALREGIREYSTEEPKLHRVGERLEKILEQTDFSVFYNHKRRLLSVGVNANGDQMEAHYDFFMSEARTASYFAIATRQAPPEHWGALNRAMCVWNRRRGPVSWTGTMFEYFMPHLLLPVPPDTLLSEALSFALFCQKGRERKIPWGISESGYLSFDDELNYQYKAHGVEPLAVNWKNEPVVSPYSSFLALPWDLSGGLENLARLEEMGAAGRYGFYEAVDFTPGRCGGSYGVIRSYMAHHIGMSMVACANALFDHVMQKRFMRNPAMGAAREFLQEKMPERGVEYRARERRLPKQKPLTAVVSQHDAPDARAPACAMLSNESLTHFFTDAGASILRWGNIDVTRNTDDLLMDPQGIYVVCRAAGESITATGAPYYPAAQKHTCVFGGTDVTYRAEGERFTLVQRFGLEKGIPAERCTVTLENREQGRLMADLLFYFEPILSQREEYEAHPAFSKLFLVGGRDASTDTLVFSRRHRDTTESLWLCVGFEKPLEYEFTLKREEAAPYPEGLRRLLRPEMVHMEGGTATPDGCCAIRLPIMAPSKGQTEVTLLLCCGKSREEAVDALVAARRGKPRFSPAPLANDSMTARLGTLLLPRLLFEPPVSESRREALLENSRAKDALWELGISGDKPVALYEWKSRPDRVVLDAYLRFWRLMRLHRLEFDLCVTDLPDTESLPVGVHRLTSPLPELLCALKAAARAVVSDEEIVSVRDAAPFSPLELTPLEAAPIQLENSFSVVGGAFGEGRFAVERVTPLPFSHVLANEHFGCLLQDAALGFTWFENSRECRLSPWKNDISKGCDGERMLLSVNNKIYDLCRGARASFSSYDARYEGRAGCLRTLLEVRIDGAAALKYLDVTLENTGEGEVEIICAYGFEPVLGVTRKDAPHVRFEQYHGNLLMHMPWSGEIPCWAAVRAPGEHPTYMTQRADFYEGKWQAQELLPNNDPIAGTLVRKRFPGRRSEKIRFILAAAPTRETALALTEPQPLSGPLSLLELDTPSEPLNRFMSGFAFHQVRAGRLWGRTGFYQSSGAYGFRDQLQDAGACLYIDPALTKEQILRCCQAQFYEGDVLHWWHPLPRGTKGVRTRFSDDLLWLPMTVCDYLDATGDSALLEIQAAYCKGELLQEGERERYQEVSVDERRESVYRHCARAIDRAWRLGDHGIPLIGTGDWNDGFSQVGAGGKGESVWLAMFFSMVLDRFAPLAEKNGDTAYGGQCRERAAALRRAVDEKCWDGKWYLRAFYDDGTPMGGRQNSECRIDLLPQAFSVLCGMPDKTRVKSALDEAMVRLVDFRHGIIKLFTPPFDDGQQNPGYIKAYPPGIRENGGQYTHAALWLAIALLREGRVEEGWALLDMINPAARCTLADLALEMKTEPYYLAADLYTHSGCYGHGGWTIYTGAAGWYCRAVLGELLGLRFDHGALTVRPRVPRKWNRFSLRLTLGKTELVLQAQRTGIPALEVDGNTAASVPLDGKKHTVHVDY